MNDFKKKIVLKNVTPMFQVLTRSKIHSITLLSSNINDLEMFVLAILVQ